MFGYDSLQIICDLIDQQISIVKTLNKATKGATKKLSEDYNRRIKELKIAKEDLIKFYDDNL